MFRQSRTHANRRSRRLNAHVFRPLRFDVLEDRTLLSASLSLSGVQTLVPGIPINVSNEPTSGQSEMIVDVNPVNPLIVAGFSHNLANTSEIDVFFSTNGGSSWATTTIHGGTGPNGDSLGTGTRFDPSIVFDANGNLYVAYGMSNGTSTRLMVARSVNGGASFTQFATVHEQLNLVVEPMLSFLFGNDKFHLASGSNPVGGQAVYIAWTLNALDPSFFEDQRIAVSGSNNSGLTWTAPLIINDSSISGSDTFNLFADPAVGPSGQLYVSWHDVDAGTIRIDRDRDGLFAGTHSFGPDITVATGESLHKFPVPAAPSRGIHTGPVLDVDRSGGAFSGRLYLSYVHQVTGDDTDIRLVWSPDQGSSWFLATVENSTGTDFLPWVDVDQISGSVNVIYYTTDGDQTTGNDDVHARLRTSIDGGDTWPNTQSVELSTTRSNVMGGDGRDYLEYIGLAVHGGTAHGLWAQNFSPGGDLDAFTNIASYNSSTGTNTLTITGTIFSDAISLRRSPINSNYLEVFRGSVREFTGLFATIDRIVVNGGLGNDTLSVGFANGNPVPASGTGLTFNAGPGSDVMRVLASSFGTPVHFFTAMFNGGTGIDRIEVSVTGDEDLTLTDREVFNPRRTPRGTEGSAVAFSSVERAILAGGRGDTSLDASAFTLGPVTLNGAAGDDILLGGAGNDHLVGGTGIDSMNGGAGNDVLSGGSGDDRMRGGDGADIMDGGGGNNVLLGEDGDDILAGNTGRDLLIGGTGVDFVRASSDDDILIPGTTAYDTDDTALSSIMAEWTSAHSYTTRILNLRDGSGSGDRLNGPYFLKASTALATVFDDDARDTLTGGAGLDWFFANLVGGVVDNLTDLARGEFVDELDSDIFM